LGSRKLTIVNASREGVHVEHQYKPQPSSIWSEVLTAMRLSLKSRRGVEDHAFEVSHRLKPSGI